MFRLPQCFVFHNASWLIGSDKAQYAIHYSISLMRCERTVMIRLSRRGVYTRERLRLIAH
jgi:hypothetical protein